MRHALLENKTIVNIIEIDPRNAGDFKNAVSIPENVGAGMGDTYEDGRFYRLDPDAKEKTEILPYDPMAVLSGMMSEQLSALQMQLDTATIDTDVRLLMLENGATI